MQIRFSPPAPMEDTSSYGQRIVQTASTLCCGHVWCEPQLASVAPGWRTHETIDDR